LVLIVNVLKVLYFDGLAIECGSAGAVAKKAVAFVLAAGVELIGEVLTWDAISFVQAQFALALASAFAMDANLRFFNHYAAGHDNLLTSSPESSLTR